MGEPEAAEEGNSDDLFRLGGGMNDESLHSPWTKRVGGRISPDIAAVSSAERYIADMRARAHLEHIAKLMG